MTLEELQKLIAIQADIALPYLVEVEINNDFQVLNEKIAYKVEHISNQYDTHNDIIIKDSANNDIGVLLFTKGREYNVNTLTEYQFVAALDHSENHTDFINETIRFDCNYVVIDRIYFNDYETAYKMSSAIWGKFSHPNLTTALSPNIVISENHIVAGEYQKFNQIPYFETAIRAISQVYPFERYLKLYHLLEMNFEYDVIIRIKALDIVAEPQKIGRLLEEYDKKEFNRIIYLFENYINDIPQLASILDLLVPFSQIAENLLFTFARKDNNPFEDINKFQLFIANGNFSYNTYRTVFGKNNTPQVILAYNAFIKKFVAFIVYRIRNSIAHSKIGEYNMSDIDKQFLTDFGEPMITEVLKQLFR